MLNIFEAPGQPFTDAVTVIEAIAIFAPLFFAQYCFVKHRNKPGPLFRSAVIILPIVAHLIAFPLLVWVLSKIFYYHTYSIQQTLRYSISEYLYLLLILYTLPVLSFQYLAGKSKASEIIVELQDEDSSSQFIKTILVSEGYKKYSVAVSEIFYCSANSPYINIHLDNHKYLHNETLKSVIPKLNPAEFVRIHKSSIVNINMVVCCKTRLNGDYDVTLKNNVQLRVSRNFAPDFKRLFNTTHQLASK